MRTCCQRKQQAYPYISLKKALASIAKASSAALGSMHVVMLPWLAFGHIIPFTELAKRIARHGHRVTLLSTPRNTRRLIDIPPDLAGLIRVVDVPLPRVERLPEGAEASIDLPSDDLRPYLRLAYDAAFAPALSDILRAPAPETSPPDWVLTDYAAHWAPEAAARHGVPCAYVSLYAAAALGFFGPPEALMGRGRYAKAAPEHLTEVPDFVPFPTAVAYHGFEARGMFAPVAVPDVSSVAELYRSGMSIDGSQVVGIRSSREFEPELYQKPVIPVGLFPQPPAPAQDVAVAGHEATLRWLDGQAPGSVVYAAFGSEAKLTSAQLETIALGLEASGLPFLWAFRAPGDGADTGVGDGGLPAGFEERVNGRGVVCRGWVPQVSFLAHGSVGAFLTHAGWNSITEGLANAVKLVLLPLMFDQGLNARHLVEKKVGVEVARDEEDGSFAPRDIAAALRRVMVEDDGEELGNKAKELARVFGNDEANNQCLRDFLRYLSEHSRNQ